MSFTWTILNEFIQNNKYEEIQDNLDFIHNNLACVSDNTGYYGDNNASHLNGNDSTIYGSNLGGDNTTYDSGDLSSENSIYKSGDYGTIYSGERSGHDSIDDYGHDYQENTQALGTANTNDETHQNGLHCWSQDLSVT